MSLTRSVGAPAAGSGQSRTLAQLSYIISYDMLSCCNRVCYTMSYQCDSAIRPSRHIFMDDRHDSGEKQQMGSALMGLLHFCVFFDRGTFQLLSLTYFYLPKSARAYLFPRSVKFITSAAAPVVLTPFVRNQQGPGGTTCLTLLV